MGVQESAMLITLAVMALVFIPEVKALGCQYFNRKKRESEDDGNDAAAENKRKSGQ